MSFVASQSMIISSENGWADSIKIKEQTVSLTIESNLVEQYVNVSSHMWSKLLKVLKFR